jgi:hypothetical protein
LPDQEKKCHTNQIPVVHPIVVDRKAVLIKVVELLVLVAVRILRVHLQVPDALVVVHLRVVAVPVMISVRAIVLVVTHPIVHNAESMIETLTPVTAIIPAIVAVEVVLAIAHVLMMAELRVADLAIVDHDLKTVLV